MEKMKTNPIYIIDARRTIVGGAFKSLKPYTAVQLAAQTIKAMLAQDTVHKAAIDQVIMGNAVSAGCGQNLARQAAVLGGVGEDVNCFSVNHVCGSSMQTILLGVQALQCTNARVILCGGSESVTHAPMLLNRAHQGEYNADDLTDSSMIDGLHCALTNKSMGDWAEALALQHQLTRSELDYCALASHQKAVSATSQGLLQSQIVPLRNTLGKEKLVDDRPRKQVDHAWFSKLSPAFKPDGLLTAGNASAPADGAAMVALASQEYVQQHNIKPLARICAGVSFMRPLKEIFQTDKIAIDQLLQQTKLNIDDIDLFEIAEAFSSQAVLAQKQSNIPKEKFNIYGGDLAYGHPLGSAGARLIVNLVHALQNEEQEKGIATISFGGSGVVGMLLSRN